ncbi:MAG: hypothetical protein GF308_12565 [Candidatus Heimdallarchaeota archaeon]|nr:hypothetical protein [Candidatus Heimdallarchaeota archaeon]
MQIFCKNRVNLQFPRSELLLDPRILGKGTDHCVFISHAHTDHLPSSRKKPATLSPIVCSKATARLFQNRKGYEITTQTSWSNDEFKIEAITSGHTFDSTAASITNLATQEKIIYTGDINTESRGYLEGYKPSKCDILILEATYGSKKYQFPSFEEQIKLARDYISEQLAQGYPVALLGYALGKAQLLNYCLGDLADIRFSQKTIWEMEQIHRELGLDLYETQQISKEQAEMPVFQREPGLLFFTHFGGKNSFLSQLKKKYNLKVVGFSGWLLNQRNYTYRRSIDAGFAISDHADFAKLLEIVRKSSPTKIFTIYGSPEKLAFELRKEGFNAIPLKKCQMTMDAFF